MGTFVEQVMGGRAGTIVTLKPDFVVLNDGVSAAAVSEIQSVAVPEKVLVIYDHDVPTGRPEAAAVLKKNLAFADKYHCRYLQARGIGYQYMLKNLVQPGQIIIGGGEHSSIFGAIGALGLNVSIPELSRVVETDRFSTIVPETLYVSLTGTLPKGVEALDAGLALLKQVLAASAGKAVELYAPGLDQHSKEVLCSMLCLKGAVTAVVTTTKPEQAVSFALDQLEPMVMLPCADRTEQGRAPIDFLRVVQGTELQAGQIGGYTGGTIEDLRAAAALMADKELAWGFRLTICPATSQDYLAAMAEGLITKFIDYGAQISAAGDHSVVIQGAGALGHKEKLVTTGLYTFAGAMGCADAQIYTTSVASVIKASQTKRL